MSSHKSENVRSFENRFAGKDGVISLLNERLKVPVSEGLRRQIIYRDEPNSCDAMVTLSRSTQVPHSKSK